MDESEIVPNGHVFVSVVGRENEEKVPLKPLILAPPAEIVDYFLPLGFHRFVLVYASLTSSANKKNKKNTSRNRIFI